MYKKDLRRGLLIENPCKHRLHNAATVKEYLFSSTAMLHCKSQYKNVGLGQYKNVGFPTFLYCLFSLHLL